MTNYEVRALWVEYEKVAMHFNDLLIRLRTQSLGGLAALGTIASVIIKETGEPSYHFAYLAVLVFGLLAAWVALAVLDLTYYDRMLIGAVSAIHELERVSESSDHIDKITLSTAITEAVAKRQGSLTSESWCTGRKLYYLIIGLLLTALWILFVALAICKR